MRSQLTKSRGWPTRIITHDDGGNPICRVLGIPTVWIVSVISVKTLWIHSTPFSIVGLVSKTPQWCINQLLDITFSYTIILDDFAFVYITLIYSIYTGCLEFSKRTQRKKILLTLVSVGKKILLGLEAGNARLWILHYHSFSLWSSHIIPGAKRSPLISKHLEKIPMRIKCHPFSSHSLCWLPWLQQMLQSQPPWEQNCLESAQQSCVFFSSLFPTFINYTLLA